MDTSFFGFQFSYIFWSCSRDLIFFHPACRRCLVASTAFWSIFSSRADAEADALSCKSHSAWPLWLVASNPAKFIVWTGTPCTGVVSLGLAAMSFNVTGFHTFGCDVLAWISTVSRSLSSLSAHHHSRIHIHTFVDCSIVHLPHVLETRSAAAPRCLSL